MRQPAEWMRPADDRILEYLKDNTAGSPSSIAEGTDYQAKYVNHRLAKLRKYNFVNRPARGLYFLTDNGRDYLSGDLDASELDVGE